MPSGEQEALIGLIVVNKCGECASEIGSGGGSRQGITKNDDGQRLLYTREEGTEWGTLSGVGDGIALTGHRVNDERKNSA